MARNFDDGGDGLTALEADAQSPSRRMKTGVRDVYNRDVGVLAASAALRDQERG